MGFWIGVAIVLLVVFGLALIGSRRRRGGENWRLSRAPGGGQAERNATGSTVTGNIQNDAGNVGGF
jgi:hypothetical protein